MGWNTLKPYSKRIRLIIRMLIMAAIVLLAAFMLYQTPGYGIERAEIKPLSKPTIKPGPEVINPLVKVRGEIGAMQIIDEGDTIRCDAWVKVVHSSDESLEGEVVILTTTEHKMQTYLEMAYAARKKVVCYGYKVPTPTGWMPLKHPPPYPGFYKLKAITTVVM